ncbi:MAG TPA: uroporphyrinogen-III synthase [Methanocorpusculum sp.]|nr:uroporphyrinogen-III synthase [Methanocorpusculum sp.]
MKIAVTRLPGKEKDDENLFASFGHTVKIVSPLTAELNSSMVQRFVIAANGGEFDAVFFTSAYAAMHIAPLLDKSVSRSYRVIGIGPKTTEILQSYGIMAELLTSYYSRDFVQYMGDWIKGKRIGIPRAAIPNPNLMHDIEEVDAFAYEYPIYSLTPSGNVIDIEDCDAILFTSAKSFNDALLPDLSGKLIMAIGDITADAMRKKGCVPEIIGDGSLKGTLETLSKKHGSSTFCVEK